MNDELSWNERKAWAKDLYFKNDQSNIEIAAAVGVDENVVRAWVSEGRWADVKRSLLTSKTSQLERYYQELDELHGRIKNEQGEINMKILDAMSKVTAHISGLQTEITISEFIEIFEPFINWLRCKDQVLSRKVITHFDAFVKQRIAA